MLNVDIYFAEEVAEEGGGDGGGGDGKGGGGDGGGVVVTEGGKEEQMNGDTQEVSSSATPYDTDMDEGTGRKSLLLKEFLYGIMFH